MKKARIISSLNSIILSLALTTHMCGCVSSQTKTSDVISEKMLNENLNVVYNTLIDETTDESEKRHFIEEFVSEYNASANFDEFLIELFDKMNDEHFFSIFPLFVDVLGTHTHDLFFYVEERLNYSDKTLKEKLELVLICNFDKSLNGIELTLSKNEFEEYISHETICTEKNQGFYANKVDKHIKLEPYGPYIRVTHYEEYFGDFKIEYEKAVEVDLFADNNSKTKTTWINYELYYKNTKLPEDSVSAGAFSKGVSNDLGSIYFANQHLVYILDKILILWNVEDNLSITIFAEWI